MSKAINFRLIEHLVFETASCSVSQRDGDCKYNISVFGIDLELKFCGFYAFYKKVKSIDLDAMFNADAASVELIYLAHCDRLLAFDIEQIVELRDFFDGTFTMLQLNSLIHEKTIRPMV